VNPAAFEYHRAGSVQEAIALLQGFGEGAKLLAGGHSLLPVMKLRLAEPRHLIDIGRVGELRGVRDDGDRVRIGALTTHHEIETDPILRRRCPLLPETAATIGDRQVRNRGTIGGALAHADAAADEPAAILALDADLVAQGPNGERTIAATDFFVDFLTTALAPDEVLTEVRVPAAAPRTGAGYQKLANQASGYAIVGVAAVVTLDVDGRCASARVGITGAAATARRATDVEEALRGAALDEATIRAASALAAEGLDPLDDLHASAEYRLQVTRGLTRRALLAAAERARSGVPATE
jgi:aerobic carbon-monoxide dehydrogenase medium subunit